MKKLITTTLFVLGFGFTASASAATGLDKYSVYSSSNTSGANFIMSLGVDGKAAYVHRNEEEGATYVQNGTWSRDGDAVTVHVESPLVGEDMTLKFVAVASLAKPGAKSNACSYPFGLKAVSINGSTEGVERFYFWPFDLLTSAGVPCN